MDVTSGVVDPAQTLAAPLQVRQFLAYRVRIPLTAVCLLFGVGVALLSPPLIAIDSLVEQLIDASGYLLIATGIGLRMWAIASIDSRKSVKLVNWGPYSLCRNPLYIGTFLIALGFVCLVQSLTMATTVLPIVLLYLFSIVPIEERVMRSHHGEAFDEYCQQTPRWIPRWNSLFSIRSQAIWSIGVRKELECAFWWLAIAAVVHITFDLRMEPWWNHFLNWP